MVNNERSYAIKAIPGKGQGLVATSKIFKGTCILSECPVFKVPGIGSNAQFLESFIIKKLKSLGKDQQRAIFSLHSAHAKSQSSFTGIVKPNALPLGSRATEGGLFLEASRINHACNPNAQNTWNANLNQLTIHAVKDVEGEEITISYLDGSESYAARQLTLKTTFGFDCACKLCSLPPAQGQQSDRKQEIQRRVAQRPGRRCHTVQA